jgi:hypothetical protein
MRCLQNRGKIPKRGSDGALAAELGVIRTLWETRVTVAAVLVALIFAGHPTAAPSPSSSILPNCFPAQAGLSAFEAQWFCGHLRAAGEARLSGERVFRFTYLPTFDAPRIVVIRAHGQEWVVSAKVLGGKGGYEPGILVRTTERKLSADEVRLLLQRLENARMWQPTDIQQELGTDGSEWLLEGQQDGKYAFHKVWSPEESTFPQYRRVCRYMLELGDILPGPGESELY